MGSDPEGEVTRILSRIGAGEDGATDRLVPLVYEELRRLAHGYLSKEPVGQTLDPTALVHEAYLRLLGPNDPGWQDRGHFFAAAAEAMRRILVERARAKQALKRGGGAERVDLEGLDVAAEERSEDLILLDEALARLDAKDERMAKIVKLRYFAGLTVEQTAAALGVAERTVHREWATARSWLRVEINQSSRDVH